MLSRKQCSVLPATSTPKYTTATLLFAPHLSGGSWNHTESSQSPIIFPLPQMSKERQRGGGKSAQIPLPSSQSLLTGFLHSLGAFIA